MARVFTRRADRILGRAVVAVLLLSGLGGAGVYYYAPPEYTRVGYQPRQPVAFSHHQHVSQLGMDCRYCHTHVEESPHSNVPSTQTCMNCHTQIKANSPLLAPVRESYASGEPVTWVRIHQVPDYVQFNHSVHVRRGVSCVSCHGQINEMDQVYHAKPLSMGWCLDCHRHTEEHLRPLNEVTNLTWKPPAGTTQKKIGEELNAKLGIWAPQTCGACHR